VSAAAESAPRQAGRPRVAALGLASLPFAGALLFAVGLAIGTRRPHIPILGLAILTALVALIPVLVDQARPPSQRHILLTLLCLSWGAFFVLPVFTQYFAGGGYDPSVPSKLNGTAPEDLVGGQIAALVALVVLLIVYALPLGRVMSRALPRPKWEWSERAALTVAGVLIPLGWLVYLASILGLLSRALGTGVLGVLAGSSINGVALLALTYLQYRSRLALLAIWITIPPTMAFNFWSGSKSLFFAPLAMLLLTYLVVFRRLRIRWVVAGITVLALFYPSAQFYRQVILDENTKTIPEVLQDPAGAIRGVSAFLSTYEFGEYFRQGLQMTSRRFTGLGILSTIVRDTPDRVPYQMGWSIGYIFLSYVPRILWPGKPETTIGQWVTDHYGGGPFIRTHTGPTWIGELYFNFGWIGVVVGMAVFGIYFRILHETLFTPDANIPARWLGVLLLWATFPKLGGVLMNPINVLPYFGGFILLVHWLVRSISAPQPAHRTGGSGAENSPAALGRRPGSMLR
jgi:hypothetical protein